MLKIHWYEGDARFGQAALDAAQAGLESVGRLIPSDLQRPVDIYIYANASDLKSALASGKEDWIAGHADPKLGIVHVLIEPGSEERITMDQRIPHELMHVMLYRRVGAGYENIPAWLREGIATLAEMYPNAEYDRVLAEAVSSNNVIPLKDLCDSFPADAGQAFLAYAEAQSFTEFLDRMYGSDGLMNLSTVYAGGVDCESGLERAFGVSLSRLESQWLSSMSGRNIILTGVQNIAPYLVLLCLILIIPLFSIVSILRKRKSP